LPGANKYSFDETLFSFQTRIFLKKGSYLKKIFFDESTFSHAGRREKKSFFHAEITFFHARASFFHARASFFHAQASFFHARITFFFGAETF
jgi:hypothetical protein